MLWLHKALAKIGIKTKTYKIEAFKQKHPQYVEIRTTVYDALGRAKTSVNEWKEHYIVAVKGENLLFFRWRRRLFLPVGKADMYIYVKEYSEQPSGSDGRVRTYIATFPYRVSFDVKLGGKYRFRHHDDKRQLEIIYEDSDRHKIYTFI